LNPAAALERLIRSPNAVETVAYRPGNHLTLSAKSSARDAIIKRQYTPRSLMLSKILQKKKNKTKLTKDNKAKQTERKTMMYIDPNENGSSEGHHHESGEHHHHHAEGHHHESRPQHHAKVPEGYYRCSHGCLCRKGMHHESHAETHVEPGMQQQMQPQMQPQMQGNMQGGTMQGAMQGMGQMLPMVAPPTANNPIINQVGNVAGGLMGMLGQGMGVANGLNQQFTALSARKKIYI